MTLIMGKSVATAEQMSKYLLSKNSNPKFSRNISALEFAQLFLDVCAKEGVRGDVAFAQCLKETGNLKYGGDVKYTQNNFAGIGATGGVTGCSFETIEIGILAQAQHLKTYATTATLNEKCVDPRRTAWFVKAKGGTSPNIESLGGTWAVPGYSTSKYKSLAEANVAKDSYGYQIVNILNDILKIKTTVNTTVSNNGVKKMKINVHAGHNPDGKTACGAVGLIKESTEARIVKNKVIEMLKSQGHEVYDCTVDNGTSASNVLSKIVAMCNSRTVDLDVSIHFNAGGNKILNRVTTGTEVLVYSSSSKAKATAQNIVNSIASLGFKNRGVKYSKTLYFLRKTKNPALLIECCFVDDPDDVALYNADKMAQAIVKGITGVTPSISKPTTTTKPVVATTTYSHKDFVKEVQSAIGAKVDGIVGSETLSKTVTISMIKNRKHAVVKPVQKYLNSIGYNCGTADGVAGSKFDSAIKTFQKANGCVVDGEITAKGTTWKKLLKL